MINPKAFPLSQMHISLGRSMGKARCEPTWSWAVDSMPDYDLWYVISGSGSIQINDSTYAITAGCCFILRPQDRIIAEQNPQDRLTVIYVHFQLVPQASALTVIFTPPPHFIEIEDTEHFESLLNRLLELSETSRLWPEAEFNWTMKLLLLQLYRHEHQAAIHPNPANKHKHKQAVHKVIDMLRQDMGQPVDYDKLAQTVQLSKRYLSQLFKSNTGKSLKEYVTKLRMDRARLLLTESLMTISQIAEAVGYADLYVFSKLFKEMNGISPSHYRKKTPPGTPH